MDLLRLYSQTTMNEKPTIALILLRAEWFDSVVALPELAELVEEDAVAIQHMLAERFDLAGIWTVKSPKSLSVAETELLVIRADLFILVFQVWAEDFYLRPLAEAVAGQPLVVWAFQPWDSLPEYIPFLQVLRGSGPVGTLEGMGTLKNLDASYQFVYGTARDPRLQAELEGFARAAQVIQKLRSARFGLIPSRNEQMQSTFVDEFRLLRDLGPTVIYLSAGDLVRASTRLPDAEVETFIAELRDQFSVRGVDEATLSTAARTSLGLAHLAIDSRLDILSYNDISPEIHSVFGLRPCLYPPLYDQAGIQVGLEGDLGAATALFILSRLAASPALFTEFWFWDEKENILIGGHAGPQNPLLALPGAVWISPDYEFAQSNRLPGAHLQFITHPGRVTLLQLRGTPTGWQAILATGEAIDSLPRLEGYPHAVIHLDASVGKFLQQVARVGSTQHWIMVYGDVRAEVEALFRWKGIPLEVI